MGVWGRVSVLFRGGPGRPDGSRGSSPAATGGAGEQSTGRVQSRGRSSVRCKEKELRAESGRGNERGRGGKQSLEIMA